MLFKLVSLQLNSFASDITINDTKTYNNRDKVKVEDRCIEFKSRVAKITFSTDLDIEVNVRPQPSPQLRNIFLLMKSNIGQSLKSRQRYQIAAIIKLLS